MYGALLAAVLLGQMASIPAGRYRPLYGDGMAPTLVAAFSIDREPVTRREFLAFAGADRRRQTGVDMSAAALDRPMTGVTWFAAQSYCAAQRKRLPTTAEWEYVAAADERRRDATRDPAYSRRLVALYTAPAASRIGGPAARLRNVYGVSALHGVVWEWTADFDSHTVRRSCAAAAVGATNPNDYAAFMRYTFRSGLTRASAQQSLGFRCAA